MPTKAKAKEEPKKAPARKKLDPKVIRAMFREPDGFFAWVKTLPPHKTIINPEMEKEDPSTPTPSYMEAFWTATTWYMRDSLGYDRYTDPDRAMGSLVEHFYGEGLLEYQPIEHDGMPWMFAVINLTDSHDRRAITAARLAMLTQDVIAATKGMED